MKFNAPLLKGLLCARKMKQWQLCRIINITEGYMSKIMGGFYIPTEQLINKIAKAVNVDPKDLIIKSETSQLAPRVRRAV